MSAASLQTLRPPTPVQSPQQAIATNPATLNRRNVSIIVCAAALVVTCIALAALTKGASLVLIVPILRSANKMIQDPNLSLYDVFLHALFFKYKSESHTSSTREVQRGPREDAGSLGEDIFNPYLDQKESDTTNGPSLASRPRVDNKGSASTNPQAAARFAQQDIFDQYSTREEIYPIHLDLAELYKQGK